MGASTCKAYEVAFVGADGISYPALSQLVSVSPKLQATYDRALRETTIGQKWRLAIGWDEFTSGNVFKATVNHRKVMAM